MTRARLSGLLLLLLSSTIFISWGAHLERKAIYGMIDFKAVYWGTRCLIQSCDPYRQNELESVYLAEGGENSSEFTPLRTSVTLYIYFPTASSLIAPLAMLPWGLAHVLWMTLTAAGLILAAFLMWDLGAKRAPTLSILLACLVLANCEFVFATGNTAGLAVSLCVVSVWCFFNERFGLAGVLCLAVSLVLKPHDGGLVWLYFLLAGGVHRKRALQTLVVVLVLSLPAVLWITHVSPHWMQELHSNLLANSAPGSLSDPRPGNFDGRLPWTIIDLQTVFSVFRDDPHIYNLATYLVFGPLLLVWILVTLRSRFLQTRAWLALAAITALSMLPVYHRPYDAKLLLLTIPACAMLWTEGGLIRWLALAVNTAAIVLTADIPLVFFDALTKNIHPASTGLWGQIETVVLARPIPLILLVVGIFYLWIYVQRSLAPSPSKG
jgi:hypothetical protein